MIELNRRQKAIINAMKYIAKNNKDMVFRCEKPNQYRQSWEYCIYKNKGGCAIDIQRLEIPVDNFELAE